MYSVLLSEKHKEKEVYLLFSHNDNRYCSEVSKHILVLRKLCYIKHPAPVVSEHFHYWVCIRIES